MCIGGMLIICRMFFRCTIRKVDHGYTCCNMYHLLWWLFVHMLKFITIQSTNTVLQNFIFYKFEALKVLFCRRCSRSEADKRAAGPCFPPIEASDQADSPLRLRKFHSSPPRQFVRRSSLETVAEESTLLQQTTSKVPILSTAFSTS